MKYFVYSIIVIVAAAIITGFFIVGSPTTERLFRFDEQRIQDLQSIQWQITDYWQNKQKLPAELADLNDDLRGIKVPTDPESGANYEYYIDSTYTFRLCATFNKPSRSGPGETYVEYPKPYDTSLSGADNWQHEAGTACFKRTIDPDFFKKTNN